MDRYAIEKAQNLSAFIPHHTMTSKMWHGANIFTQKKWSWYIYLSGLQVSKVQERLLGMCQTGLFWWPIFLEDYRQEGLLALGRAFGHADGYFSAQAHILALGRAFGHTHEHFGARACIGYAGIRAHVCAWENELWCLDTHSEFNPL